MKHVLARTILLSCLSLPMLAQAQHFNGQYDMERDDAPRHMVGNTFISSTNDFEHRPWQVAREADYISKAQAIDIARHRTKGKILSADLVQKNQHAFYKIKVLTDSGRIKTLRINAQAK